MASSVKKPQKSIALVLGGGASKGVAMLGIIEELEKLNVHITAISGTSVGAIIGAYYAVFGEISSLKEEVMSFTKRDWLKFADVNRIPKQSFIKGKRVRKFLESKFGERTFADTKIPLVITVTNLTKGEVEYMEKGKIIDAVMMSSAYPGIFPPITKKGDLYVDGGVLDNLPYAPFLKKRRRKIVVVNLFHTKIKHKSTNIKNLITSSINLMMANAYNAREIDDDRLFFIQPKFKNSVNIWNFSDLEEKYELGMKTLKKRKRALRKWLKS